MTETLQSARLHYAEELRFITHMTSRALFAAFASVPRERFVGPGPWRILGRKGFWTTDDADPRHVYHNVLIAINEAKGINNGQPSLWAHFLDELDMRPSEAVVHLGCGTGYYTAILAELVAPDGRVTAIELDEAIAERARHALEGWPHVTVLHGDGSNAVLEPADVIVASAGATHPMPAWLAPLRPGGRLLFPLSPAEGAGAMAFLKRLDAEIFEARLAFGTFFIPFSGACDPEVEKRLSDALKRDRGAPVKSLRLDPHAQEQSCWLHGDGWCFSTRDAMPAN